MYDHAERRRSLRKQRERGCSIYIPSEELEKAGFSPDDPPPFYRTWGGARGRVVIQLYRTREAARRG